MEKLSVKLGALLVLAILSAGAQAATCTSRATGNWGTASTWTCTAGTVPANGDTVVLASPFTVTLNASYTAAALTINSGATLADTGGRILTVTGNITNNGTFTSTNNGTIASTGNGAVISGSGTFSGTSRLYTSGTAVSIAAGSALNFTGTSRLYAGRNAAGNTVAGSVLTINGNIIGTTQTGGTGTPWIRLYATNTVVSSTGAITATGTSTATIQFRATGTLTNNGNVTIGTIVRNAGTGTWTNAANSSLTVNRSFTTASMILNASATGNTVTFNTPAVAITPSGNPPTYYNLAGSGVTCPNIYTILGSSPCVLPPGVVGVTRSPGTCANVTGIGTVAWGTPTNAQVSDTLYATRSVARNVTTNYLRCTNYGFAIPAGSTILGIAVNVVRKTSGNTVRDAAMRIVKNVAGVATIQAIDRSTLTNYTTTDVAEIHGGSTDLWGTTWTLADINTTNFGAAFAAKNVNSNTRTASVNHMPITVYYSTPSIHHIEIDHPGSGSTCTPTNVSVKACGDAACNLASLYTQGASVTLTPGGNVVAVGASGTGGGTVSSGTAGTVTLAASSNPAAANATICKNTVSGATSCSFTFNSGSISLAVPDGVSGNNVMGTLTACPGTGAFTGNKSINFYTGYANPATGTLQATVNGTTVAKVAPGTAIILNFNASNQATFTLAYPDVGQVTLNANYTGTPALTNGTASFLMKPAGFVLSNIKQSAVGGINNPGATDASGAAFVKAGEPFSVTVTAVNSVGTATPNYGQGIPPEAVKLTPAVLAGLGMSSNVPEVNRLTTGSIISGSTTLTVGDSTDYVVGDRIRIVGAGAGGADFYSTIAAIPTLGAPGVITLATPVSTSVSFSQVHYTFAPFVGGVATGTNFTWDEVGIITLMPRIADGTYQTAGDVIGDRNGNPSGPVGRFTLGKFALQNVSLDDRADLNICNNGVLVADGITACPFAFTYMGEQADVNFTLVPKSLSGAVVHNYVDSATAANDFAKLDLTAFANLNLAAVDRASAGGPYYLSPRVSIAAMPAYSCDPSPTPLTLCFASGSATMTVPFTISRNPTADGAYGAVDIGIAMSDADGARVEGAGATPTLCNNPNAIDCYDLDTDATPGNDHALLATTEFRYGHSKISNAHGSELLPLLMPIKLEYWDSTTSSYITSVDDSISLLTVAFDPLSYQRNLNAGETLLTQPIITNGIGQIGLSKPGANNNGSVDVSVTAPVYLPGTARATFGVYKGSNEFIYQREAY